MKMRDGIIHLLLGLVMLVATACGNAAASQPPPTPTPVVVSFEMIAKGEPVVLPVGGTMTLSGYAPDAVEISDEQIVQRVPPDPNVSETAPPQTTLIANIAGSAQVTVTQSLCEGISSCNGPLFFWKLQVQVK